MFWHGRCGWDRYGTFSYRKVRIGEVRHGKVRHGPAVKAW